MYLFFLIKNIWIIMPLIILIFYLFNCIYPFKWLILNKLSSDNKSRVFYSSCILWYLIFACLFYQDISKVEILSTYNKGTSQVLYNYFLITIIFILLCLTINLLFLKRLAITKLNIKGIELSVNEIDEVTKSAIIWKESYELACSVILNQYKMISNVTDYINNLDAIDESTLYVDFLKSYEKLRENIKIQCYYYNKNGLLHMKQKNKLTDEEFSTIQYSLDINGVCIPPQKTVRTLYAKIVTSFVFPDIIIKIDGENLYDQEHLIIQNIIYLFDKELIINSKE